MAPLVHRGTAALMAAMLLASLSTTSALARASSFTSPIVVDLTGEIMDGCDEPIVLSGVLRDVLHITWRADGSLTFVSTTHPAGLTGTGLISGSVYRGTGATHQTIISGAPDETSLPEWGIGTLIIRQRLVGTAGAVTFDFRLTFHFTKLDHENVVKFERWSVTCS